MIKRNSPKIQPNILSILFLLFIIIFPGCVNKELSVEEAKEVSVSMRDEVFVPPPRNIDDILSLLKQTGSYDSEVATSRTEILDSKPPEDSSSQTLAKFYLQRGRAANDLGLSLQAYNDLNKAYSYYDGLANSEDRKEILFNLALAERRAGNVTKAIDLLNETIASNPIPRDYLIIIGAYKEIGNFQAAEKACVEGISLAQNKISRMTSSIKNRQLLAEKISGNMANLAHMRAMLHDLRGEHDKEEYYWREGVRHSAQVIKKVPSKWINAQIALANYLTSQKKFMEAELEAREAVKKSIGLSGKINRNLANALHVIAKIKMTQGRYGEAEELTRHELVILKESGIPDDSSSAARARGLLAKILTNRGNHADAVHEYDFMEKSLKENNNLFKTIVLSPELLLSLLEVGRTEEAMAHIIRKYEKYLDLYGNQNISTAQYLALRGTAKLKGNDLAGAYNDFVKAVPLLIEAEAETGGVLFKFILENYIALLAEISGTDLENSLGINAAGQAFSMAEALRGKIVQNAVAASSARTSVADPVLADLIRKEQDALQQRDALQETLANILGLAPTEQDKAVINSLKEKITNLTLARKAFLKEIKNGFPSYSELIKPSHPTISDIQEVLTAQEALISIFAGNNKTYIWTILPGQHKFSIANYNKKQLKQIVADIRKSLNPEITTLGDIPAFDLNKAHDIYSALLKSSEKEINSAQSLIVIADGPLGALPFTILPIRNHSLSTGTKLFDEYRAIEWLIRKFTISRMPSASTLTALRSVPPGDSARKAFIGFGDPFFSEKQAQEAKEKGTAKNALFASRGGKINLRGVRFTSNKNLDSAKIISSQLEKLIRLPDTASEIMGIATSLNADLEKDIFLGKKASEETVKNIDLSDRRVIAFATHALVPGDLDGLQQPALALSAPAVTGNNDDGLLTMGEVLKLKLNADWVVLSACNTGAASGEGAEALSGLGRSFFYAGTRSILASMWPVETTSAFQLTTGIFKNQKKNSAMSRAEALQKSIISLIDGPGLIDKSSGKTVASYAHPLFWAPFILVGDGR